MKKLILPIGALLLSNLIYAQLSPLPNTENYIQTKTYLDYNGTSATKSSETVQYFDGLGRPKQIVNVKASPLGKDVVTPIKYDQFGRQVQEYLPIPQGGTLNGAIIPDPLSNVSSTPYGSEKIYSEKVLENSPLDRIQQQIQVGTDWSTKPVKFEYDANKTTEEVRKFTTVTTWENGATKSVLAEDWLYTDNQLYKNTVIDEDGNKTIEFKNGRGQVIMVRKEDGSSTYYVYNEYNQLAFVLPPMGSMRGDIVANITKQDEFCYQYRYDGKGRLVEKKLPGKGWEYMVYDKADRMILSQDANLRKSFDWIIYKYDVLGRPIYTGIVKSNNTRIGMQNQILGGAIIEGRDNTPLTANGMPYYYTNMHWGLNTLLSVTYYDSYPQQYGFNPPVPSTILGEPVLTDTPTADGRSTKGLPVLSLVKNVEDDGWTKNYTYYDRKGRAIGSHSINYLGGYTHTESKLDFAGLPQQTITKHKRLNSDTERVITETFEYDNQNRLLVHKHQVDSNPVEILAQNKYNELSQLESKKVGGVTASSPLQQIDYKYNIRGWMTQINDPAALNGKLFGYKVKYQNSDNPSYKKFNGNISEVDWKTSVDDLLKRYIYAYDPLNRLTTGYYQEPTTSVPVNHFYNEEIAYDANGNITRLQRNMKGSSNTAEYIDNIQYTYQGNRLLSASDLTQNFNGYPTGGNLIDYDDNGNMINHKDKGISSIQYNYLNLPGKITQSSKIMDYSYRADGVKVRKVFDTKTTDYLDGFQYENSVLKFFPTAEGYFNVETGKYVYNYTDHLGNIRVSYAKNGAGTEIIEESNYYPFGLKHGISNPFVGNPSYNYKYNGKELQETGMYDYGARMYMPDLGRWGVVDPLAEMYHPMSTYNYGGNNPIHFIDPNGMNLDTWEINESNGELNKVDDNDRPDELYVVDKSGNRKVNDKGDQVKFTMERDGQIQDRIQSSENVKYNGIVKGKIAELSKDIPFEVYKFENQENAKSFFEFLDNNSKAGNEFDLLQYTEGTTDKGMVGRTLQFKYLTRIDSNGDIGGFLPSLQLNYYKNFLNTSKGIQHLRSIYTHSHPDDGKNPMPSSNDLRTAENPYIPIPTFRVYSEGVYNTFKP